MSSHFFAHLSAHLSAQSSRLRLMYVSACVVRVLTLFILSSMSSVSAYATPVDPLLGLKLEAGMGGLSEAYLRGEVSYPLSSIFLLQSAYSQPLLKGAPSLALGGRAQLDVFHYVPWVGLLSTYEKTELNQSESHINLGVEFGLDRKLSNQHAVSLSLRLPSIITRSGGPLADHSAWRLGVSWRYDWLLFDPFDE